MTSRRPRRAGGPRRAGSRRSAGAAGFSLVEVLFALTFLAVGIMAVAAMIPAGTQGITKSRVITTGLMAAQIKMEQLRGTPFTALNAGTFSDTTSIFTRTWTVTDSVPMSGCKRIRVTCAWTDNHGAQTTQLTSYVSR